MQGKINNEQDKMSFDGFCKCVQMDLQKQLSNVGASVELKTITKNNNTKYPALIITEPGCNTSPVIPLGQFYKMYLYGEELAKVEHKIVKCYAENAGHKFETAEFTEWDNISEKIVYRLVNFERNKELLGTIPHRRFLDLAITYYFICNMPFAESHCGTIQIANKHLEMWNKTEEDLYSTASKNTLTLMPFKYAGIMDVIDEHLSGCEKNEPPENARSLSIMNVLTNKQGLYGAAAILYQHLLKNIAEKTGTDLYILPCSMHEVILLPAVKNSKCAELINMVKNINQTILPEDEFLSNNIYCYSRGKDQISICGVEENE